MRQATYNAQHQPLTSTDAAGQTTTFTYNTRGHDGDDGLVLAIRYLVM